MEKTKGARGAAGIRRGMWMLTRRLPLLRPLEIYENFYSITLTKAGRLRFSKPNKSTSYKAAALEEMSDDEMDSRIWRIRRADRETSKLLLRPGNLVGPSFEPGPELRDDLGEYARVLVVGVGGLGCELLKDLALSGFKNLDIIDMDRIEMLGSQKLVAAKRVMERVSDGNIVPHFCRIEDKELDFYSDFNIIVLGLDSIEARSYINAVACSFLEYDADDNPKEETMKPMVDGGTGGFQGHARVILPGLTPCFECTIWLFPPQVHRRKAFDPDELKHMEWVYREANKRAELFGIPGVTYSLTQGVVKNIIPAIASTNAIISAAYALETLKIASGCNKTLSNYLTYNGVEGVHFKATEFERD
ncbi:hypothetical protein SAY87_003744 [Trapa incisa]|uniref:NEDD8-activating enzyme E1 catalytic subunit n=1 Tax=Trapa incisa TaxID=236973 RepID=A0AAN7QJM0_9MYRT|nr:hypothetical protein SAY87_003744 [Trapa incisa]